VQIEDEALREIASRSRGTPRIANRLLRRVRDYALVDGRGASLEAVQAALELYDVDELGLDRLDRAVMSIILERFDGGPVGLNTLAVSVGEEAETIEAVVEPFLVRIGLLSRTPRGRIATKAGWAHFGIPRNADALFGDDL
jgi:Holliday junction DNA helicase RuvB